MKAWKTRSVNPNGKRGITFKIKDAYLDLPVVLPCRQCPGCRLEHSRQWAVRCYHESQLYEENAFITLTFNDENLPEDNSLNVRHWQLFMKRLKKHYKGKKIRFYHCGEYGDKLGRPHYHACLFGHDFEDKKFWKLTDQGDRLYTSEILEKVWPYGYSTIGDVTFKSAAYVARYIMKKITGDQSEKHYTRIDKTTGEIHHLKPEYTTMSRFPGLGAAWLLKYKTEVYPCDFIIINGKKCRPPKYYDQQQEVVNPNEHKILQKRRKKQLKKHAENNTPERLKVREKIQNLKIEKLERKIK